MRTISTAILTLGMAVGITLAGVSPARAATFNVTTVGEFQTALTTAGANGEDDTINVAAGTYDVSGGALSYAAQSTMPEENYALTITGAGAGQTILDAGDNNECLNIFVTDFVFDDSAAAVTITDLTVQAGSSANDGGGIYVRTQNAPVVVARVTADSNASVGDGGGLYIRSTNGAVTLDSIAATGNTSAGSGAGAYAQTGGSIVLTGSVVSGNTTTADNTGAGVHLFSLGANVTIDGSTFVGNEALAIDAIAGGSYQETFGGGLITFTNNSLSGNASISGGGAYFNGPNATVTGNTVSGNHATNAGGGMLFEMQGGTVTMVNNNVWGNTADVTGGDIRLGDGAADTANLSFNNYADLTRNGAGTLNETDNVNVAPQFVSASDPDPAKWDLHLAETSPLVDAGDSTGLPVDAVDIDGDPRLVDGNVDGTAAVDIGADEFVPAPIIVVSTTTIDFQTNPGARSVTVTNDGTALAIGTIGATDALAAPFSITEDTCSGTVLINGTSCTIGVEFAPAGSSAAAARPARTVFAMLGFVLLGGVVLMGGRKRRVFLVATALVVVVLAGACLTGDNGNRQSYGDSFDIPSNDAANPSVTVNVAGRY